MSNLSSNYIWHTVNKIFFKLSHHSSNIVLSLNKHCLTLFHFMMYMTKFVFNNKISASLLNFLKQSPYKDGACVASRRSSGFAFRHYDVGRTYVHHTISWRMITINNPGTRDTHQQDLSLEFATNVLKIWAETTADSWRNISSSNSGVSSVLTQRIFEFLCET